MERTESTSAAPARRWPLAVGALGALLLAAGLGGSMWYREQGRRQAKVAAGERFSVLFGCLLGAPGDPAESTASALRRVEATGAFGDAVGKRADQWPARCASIADPYVTDLNRATSEDHFSLASDLRNADLHAWPRHLHFAREFFGTAPALAGAQAPILAPALRAQWKEVPEENLAEAPDAGPNQPGTRPVRMTRSGEYWSLEWSDGPPTRLDSAGSPGDAVRFGDQLIWLENKATKHTLFARSLKKPGDDQELAFQEGSSLAYLRICQWDNDLAVALFMGTHHAAAVSFFSGGRWSHGGFAEGRLACGPHQARFVTATQAQDKTGEALVAETTCTPEGCKRAEARLTALGLPRQAQDPSREAVTSRIDAIPLGDKIAVAWVQDPGDSHVGLVPTAKLSLAWLRVAPLAALATAPTSLLLVAVEVPPEFLSVQFASRAEGADLAIRAYRETITQQWPQGVVFGHLGPQGAVTPVTK